MHRSGQQQFEQEVFAAELAEISLRRKRTGGDRPAPEDTAGAQPSTEHGLVGLAFSGGGIRSAAFSLGVTQVLLSHDLFKRVDYLSTVSGGGYTGSCLSALMQGDGAGERALVDRAAGGKEPVALEHLRNYSNFLLGRGLLDGLRMPALAVAGALHTLLLVLPLVVLLVFVTEILFEIGSRALPGARHWLSALGLVPLVIAVLFRPVRAGLGSWAERDAQYRHTGIFLLLAVCALIAIPSLSWLGELVRHDAGSLFEQLYSFVRGQFALGHKSWLLWGLFIVLGLIVWGAVRLRLRMLLVVVAALGPLVLLSIYVVICVYAITSPVTVDKRGLAPAVARLPETEGAKETPCGTDARTSEEREVELLVDPLLRTKGFDPRNYQIQWEREHTQEPLTLLRCGAPVSWWSRLMFTGGNPVVHMRFKSGWLTGLSEDREATGIIVIDELSVLHGQFAWWLYFGGLVLWLYNQRFVSVNRISMHPFYRDRLSRTFLIRQVGDGLASADDLKLSQLGGSASRAPYHLINTALNLQGSKDPRLRERKSVPLLLAAKFCGSDYTGYCRTEDMESRDPHFNLGTAMAISAAAAAPNMGALSFRSLSFVMALLNIRLNYWLPNPVQAHHTPWYFLDMPGRVGLGYLLAEALGRTSDHSAYVNCSDGGHIENLGVYELLKRRCKTIICVDGEADPNYFFTGLVTLQRYAQIDFGARVEIGVSAIRPGSDLLSRSHYAVGRVIDLDGEESTLIYIKLAYTGDEPEYLNYYRRRSQGFPHQSTGNQFFGETQFEAYRALGVHAAEGAIQDLTAALRN